MTVNEINFYNWLQQNNVPKKNCCDMVSRIKKIEKALISCDIDEEYKKNKCRDLLNCFYNCGRNENMANRLKGDLPIGKYYLAAYKYAVKKYIKFRDSFKLDNP